MDNFKISDFQNLNRQNQRGTCKVCNKPVQWAAQKVAARKMFSCPTASEAEKAQFKRPRPANLNSSGSNLFNVEAPFDKECNSCNLNEGMKDFVKTLNPAYARVMPTTKSLYGSLLDQKYDDCSDQLQRILGDSNNLNLVSDGWTNIRGDHIVNFCIKAPNQKPFFHSSINTSGICQDAHAVSHEIIAVLEKLGPEKFSSVVTDNANVMRSAWKLIETRFPHISVNGCAAHVVNLLIKDILDNPDYSKSMKEAEKIIKFVTNHHIVKVKYEEKRKSAKVPRTLSMPVVTRWYSRYTSMTFSLQDMSYVNLLTMTMK